jgi:hypothetical protein
LYNPFVVAKGLFFVRLHVNSGYMKTSTHRHYHLFLLLAVLNMLMFYVFIGRSTIEAGPRGFFTDPLFNYFFFVSGWLLITWIIYFLCRDVLKSKRLTIFHLLITTAIVFILPVWVTQVYVSAPRRFIDYVSTSPLFGSFTQSFILTITLLVLSDLLLLMNFFKKD